RQRSHKSLFLSGTPTADDGIWSVDFRCAPVQRLLMTQIDSDADGFAHGLHLGDAVGVVLVLLPVLHQNEILTVLQRAQIQISQRLLLIIAGLRRTAWMARMVRSNA